MSLNILQRIRSSIALFVEKIGPLSKAAAIQRPKKSIQLIKINKNHLKTATSFVMFEYSLFHRTHH